MRTQTVTGLTLQEYCELMGIDVWTMAQVGAGFPSSVTPVCDKPIFSHQWQQDYLSRDEFSLAIRTAEQKIAQALTYWPYPYSTIDEVQPYPQGNVQTMRGGGANARGYWKSLTVNWGKVIAGGLFVRTVIDANAAIVRTDEDGDGIKEIATVTAVVPAGTSASEIALYLSSADRVGIDKSDSERYRIRPIYASVSGVNVTIRCHSAQMIIPALQEGFDAASLDVSVDANYLTSVSVYRVYIDTTATADNPNQGNAIWENIGCDGEDCGVTYSPLCIGARNAEIGQVLINWKVGSPPFNYDPARVQLNYISGVPLIQDRMQYAYADTVAKLATALLPNDVCGCERAQRIIAFWREAIFSAGTDETPNFAPDDAGSNPFGVQRGAVEAWRAVLDMRQVWGVRL